ncbi:hypothetical protein AEA09_11325 [Lysinibacillus contaminans]|uniref:DUF5658 domain-containing protein n=1 Tax=Lysinibacillus contaminans TaxID=1293441 RepID=A0ABR5K2X6_9BACI|nr:DUF5658 family protein [Lysinibacillus contaminans]KOS69076.1 hypothetical protein AEA09_11325 [Lysinibacillus contaminans]
MKNKRFIIYCSVLVALLNLFDGIATHYGLLNNMIEELNPLMDYFMAVSPLLFLCIKIVLSILILCASYWVYQKSKVKFQQLFLYSLVGVSVMYIGIFCMHIFWLSFL